MSLTCNRCDVVAKIHSVSSPSSCTMTPCDTEVVAECWCDIRHNTCPVLWDTSSTVDVLFENKLYIYIYIYIYVYIYNHKKACPKE